MSETPDPLLGRELAGKYRLTALIGQGGFGSVYLAIQRPVDRKVAVKVIGHSGGDSTLRARFFREAKVLAGLKDPSTVTLHDYGEEPDGLLYMVQEFVDGVTLHQAIRKGRKLLPERAVDIACQVLHALYEAHQADVVHRDIKPANIMLTEGREGTEVVKVLDFGIAKLIGGDSDGLVTTRGHAVGTPTYMAPEQTRQKGLGPATDQYAVAVVLYRMLFGRVPYRGQTHYETIKMHRSAPLPPMDGLAPTLVEVLSRALAKKPTDRYADAREMRMALEAIRPSLGEKPGVSDLEKTAIAPPAALMMGSTEPASPAPIQFSDPPAAAAELAAAEAPAAEAPTPSRSQLTRGPNLLAIVLGVALVVVVAAIVVVLGR